MKTWQTLLLLSASLALSPITAPAFTLTERPDYTDYTNAVTIGTWCGKAVEERGIAVGDSTAFLPKASSQQGIVIMVKQNIQSRYPSYVKPGIADVPGVLNTYGVTGFQWSNDEDFLTFCGLPSGGFSATPYFTLQSPAASNGWYVAKGCLTNMVWTENTAILDQTATTPYTSDNTLWFGFCYPGGVELTTNWMTAIDTVGANWEGEYGWYVLPGACRYSVGASWDGGDGNFYYVAEAYSQYGIIGYADASPIGHSADVYFITKPEGSTWVTPVATNMFNNQGFSLASTNWTYLGGVAETIVDTTGIVCGVVGDLGIDPGLPTFGSSPDTNGYLLGWSLSDAFVVLKWNGVNGFQYK